MTPHNSLQLRYEALKEALGSYGQVQHVNYRTGNDSGFVRFADEAGCKAALEGTKEGGFEVRVNRRQSNVLRNIE